MQSPVIQLNDVHFSWSSQIAEILHIKQLSIAQGEHLFIQGSSGSGKTTLLNILTGINKPNTGSVQVLGTELNHLTSSKLDQFRVDHLGVIFQQFNLLPYLSILENVQLPCWFSDKRMERVKDLHQTSTNLLQELQIPKQLFSKSVNTLSVGQQQRVAVARALIGKPEIIIADEPTSALDTDNRLRFIELLFYEADQQNSTVIFVSHDPNLAQYFSRVIKMSDINHANIS